MRSIQQNISSRLMHRVEEKYSNQSNYAPDNYDRHNDQDEDSPEIPFEEIPLHQFAHGEGHSAMWARRRLVADLLTTFWAFY